MSENKSGMPRRFLIALIWRIVIFEMFKFFEAVVELPGFDFDSLFELGELVIIVAIVDLWESGRICKTFADIRHFVRLAFHFH